MRKVNVKIGMKVIPSKKLGHEDVLHRCYSMIEADKIEQPYLYVIKMSEDGVSWLLNYKQDGHGDYFDSYDFEPYIKIKGKIVSVNQNTFICEIGIKTQFVDINKEPLYTGDYTIDNDFYSIVDSRYINIDTSNEYCVSQARINQRKIKKWRSYEDLKDGSYDRGIKIVLAKEYTGYSSSSNEC